MVPDPFCFYSKYVDRYNASSGGGWFERHMWEGPSTVESLIPFWGSYMGALHSAAHDDSFGVGLNLATLGLDVAMFGFPIARAAIGGAQAIGRGVVAAGRVATVAARDVLNLASRGLAAGGRSLSQLNVNARMYAGGFGRELRVSSVNRTFRVGELMPNGETAGMGPGARFAGELEAGQSGRFGDLIGRVGDDLTPHHMPQKALGFTSEADGGALVLPFEEHVLTRTYWTKGRILARIEAGLPFREVLARDIYDMRSIAGTRYNSGMLDLIEYYKTNFRDLMKRSRPISGGK